MGSPFVRQVRRPPLRYRLARAFQRVALVVLVVLALYLSTVAYSAFELVQSSPRSGSYSAGFASNASIAVQGDFTLTNPGFYPVAGLTLELRLENSTGAFLGVVRSGSVTIAPRATASFPISVYVPVSPTSAAASLLVTDQYLTVGVWGNATYAYLFPVSIHFDQNRSWGAPFSNFRASVGAPVGGGGALTVPITITYTNHAVLTEYGSLSLALIASNDTSCGSTSFSLNVPPGGFFDQTENATLAPGCSVSGGTAVATYVAGGATIPLPPEPIP